MVELERRYKEEIVPKLIERLGLKSVMQVPRLEKIVVNIGVGDAKDNKKLLEASVRELTTVTGQKPVITKARKSVSNFKIRAGMPIGAKVTLRGGNMYHFLNKLIFAALPRVRDFQGLARNGFDGRGNYNLGVKEQLMFPEINYDLMEKVRGMNISFVTSTDNNDQAFALLEEMGLPFMKARRQ